MAWRDDLFPASYNDVPFAVMSHDRSGGRRLDVHEFPHREKATLVDLGRKANELSLEIVVIGDDYLVRRDQLLAELDRGTIGRLSHPYLGLLNVAVQSWKLGESIEAGRMCRLSVTFIDGEALPSGGVITVTADKVVAAAGALKKQSTLSLARMAVPTSPASILEKINTLSALASQIASQVSQLQGWADTALVGPLASVLRSAQTIRNNLQRLVALPVVLADTLAGLSQGLFDLFDGDPDSGFAVAMTWADGAISGDELSNWQAQAGLASAAVFLSQRTFDMSANAIAAQDALLASIERLQATADDDIYIALIDLRAAVVVDVSARAAQLPVITTYQTAATLPALVVAHLIYGDASWEADLAARNGVRHPGFVPGGLALEVLSHG